MCKECYVEENRITPLLNPLECLKNHTQYICGTCGRCICIERDANRGLQRWNFPFKEALINCEKRINQYHPINPLSHHISCRLTITYGAIF